MVSENGKNFSQGGNYLQRTNSGKNIRNSFKTLNWQKEKEVFQHNKEQFEQLERNPNVFQSSKSPSKFNMGNPNKDSDGTTGDITSPWDARQAAHNLSWEREARDATLAKQVGEAIAREMAKAHAQYQAILNERGAAAVPTSLKMTSGALGFKVMDPFNWTKDKAIYQRWQMWSEMAR